MPLNISFSLSFAYAGQVMFSTPTLFFFALSFLFGLYGLNCHQFFVTIVKSQSMMPTLHRGDILFSTNSDVKVEVKDIVLAQVSKEIFGYRFNKRNIKLRLNLTWHIISDPRVSDFFLPM